MKNHIIRISLLAVVLFSVPFVEATEKIFECTVGSYTTTGTPLSQGWKYKVASAKLNAPLKEWGGIYHAQVLSHFVLPGGYEIVFTLSWRSGDLANDDISVIQNPSFSLNSRLQKVGAQPEILDIDEDGLNQKSYPGMVPRQIFVSNRLNDTSVVTEIWKQQKDPRISSYDLSMASEEKAGMTTLYSLDCSTDL